MSKSTLDIYKAHLDAQLGENSPITIRAIIDPSGLNAVVYGVFDDTDYFGNKDGGNVRQFLDGRRFILSIKPAFDVYDNLELYFPDLSLTYKIQRIDTDLTGAQVLWVY